MSTPTRPKPSRPVRAAALLVALLCLWMATGGVVGHTDDLRGGGSASATVVWTHKLAADAPTDACAACQWLAAIRTGGPTLPVVTFPTRHTPWTYPAPRARAFGHAGPQNGPRAPPACLFPCSALSPV